MSNRNGSILVNPEVVPGVDAEIGSKTDESRCPKLGRSERTERSEQTEEFREDANLLSA